MLRVWKASVSRGRVYASPWLSVRHTSTVPEAHKPPSLPEHAVISTFDLFSIGGMSMSVLAPQSQTDQYSQSVPRRLTLSVPCALEKSSSMI